MGKYLDIEIMISNELAKRPTYRKPKMKKGTLWRCKIVEPSPVDVVEVKHGYWCDKYKNGTVAKQGVVSSCCDMLNERRTKYCPYCGAIMDEERKE